jgi:hypothetical protein
VVRRGCYIGMMVLSLFLLASTAAAGVPDEPERIRFEILIAGGSPSGFEIDAQEQAEVFEGDPHRGQRKPERFVADQGTFALARSQLARYRPLVAASGGCAARPSDVMAFRISWFEQGTSQSVTFADSCQGIPTDLIDALRPVGERLDRASSKASDETEVLIAPE